MLLNTSIDIFICKCIKNRTNSVIGIYKITSPTGGIYIGQAIDIENRFTKYRNLSCKGQTRLYNSFIKHGVKNHTFEIIHLCNEEELNYWEDYYVKLYNTFNTPHGLNLKEACSKGRLSEETKKRISDGNKKPFLSYKKCKEWVSKNLKSITTQAKWKKITSELPLDIPKDPQVSYKNIGWISWGDFLGTGNIHKGIFLSYEEAKKWVKENSLTKNIKSRKEWKEINNKLPDFITKDPITYYTRRGEWKGWGDFLGTGRVANMNVAKYFVNYNEAKKWVNENLSKKINTQDKWKKNTNNIPLFIPKNPQQYYKKTGDWISWNHFLENGRGYNFLSYNEAKKWIKKSKFKGIKLSEWRKQTHNLPSFIPKEPYSFYKKIGTWINWNDFINN